MRRRTCYSPYAGGIVPVPESSRIAYYNRVLSGTATSQKDRIMRYYLSLGRPATRHEAVDRYFCVHPGPRALDGGRPIPWQSAGGALPIGSGKNGPNIAGARGALCLPPKGSLKPDGLRFELPETNPRGHCGNPRPDFAIDTRREGITSDSIRHAVEVR